MKMALTKGQKISSAMMRTMRQHEQVADLPVAAEQVLQALLARRAAAVPNPASGSSDLPCLKLHRGHAPVETRKLPRSLGARRREVCQQADGAAPGCPVALGPAAT